MLTTDRTIRFFFFFTYKYLFLLLFLSNNQKIYSIYFVFKQLKHITIQYEKNVF
jgi:hypothetical protein